MSREPAPSIEATAVRGASWTISAGLVSRVLVLLGSVAITHYLDPPAVGEVGAAVVLVLLANQISNLGVGPFILARQNEGPRAVFHANVLHLVVVGRTRGGRGAVVAEHREPRRCAQPASRREQRRREPTLTKQPSQP